MSGALGSASAPVSRQNSRAMTGTEQEGEDVDVNYHDGNEPSPPSSEGTAVGNGNGNGDGNGQPQLFLKAPTPPAVAGARGAPGGLGSASAPSSPGTNAFVDPRRKEFPMGGSSKDDSAVGSTHHRENPFLPGGHGGGEEITALPHHPDPAVAAGLIHPNASEAMMPEPDSLQPVTSTPAGILGDGEDGIRRRDHHEQQHHHHHHNHSGRPTPPRYNTNFDPYGMYAGRPNHQRDVHSKPVFSLARPLPTKEQRDAQKAYRESVRANAANRAAGGKGTHHPASTSGPAIGPGGHHYHNTAGGAMIGPGAHHAPAAYGSYYGPAPGTQSSHHHSRSHSHNGSRAASFIAPAAGVGVGAGAASLGQLQDRDQLLGLLRQLLNEGEGGNANGDLSRSATPANHNNNNNKDVMEDQAMARKEGFGNDDKGNKTAERTRAAERRGSVSSGSSDSSCSSSNSSNDDNDGVEAFPNPWARFRHTMREPFAEFWGTFLLIMFGTGVSLQYFLTLDPNVTASTFGTYTNVSLGWGVGVAMGVWVAGGISGGHINPAVTISLAVFRGFPWKKVPGYVLAQILGAMTAAGVNYGLYRGAIDIFEGGAGIRTYEGPTATASLFSTYPQAYVSNATAFFQEFIDSAILLMVVLAISDINNSSPPDGLNPLVLFLLIVGIGACLGVQTAYCINPARDLGPRIVTWMAGYGRGVWNFRNQYWLWTCWCATIAGALFGAFLYDAFIYTGSESPLNRKWEFPWMNKERKGFGPATKDKAPAGDFPSDQVAA